MRKNKLAAIIVVCTIAVIAAIVIPRVIDGTEKALVTTAIDGDTVELADGRHVRYLGIDAPESGDYYAENATEKNRELVEGKIVELLKGKEDKDRYGRLLRYVYVDGVFVNAELIAGGYAMVYMFDPDDWRSEALVEWEDYAILRGLGLWGEGE
jgi:micrococcal nuclease